MSDEQETISDIVAEMRRMNPEKFLSTPWYCEPLPNKMRSYADRIEAAAKSIEADRDNWRRQALDEDARANAATVKDSLTVGNAAAIREALDAITRIDTRMLKRLLCELVEADIFDGGQIRNTIHAVEKARQALSAPPRNCDVLEWSTADDEFEKAMGFPPSKTADERDEIMRENWFLFKHWLFAEAKGETDGSK